MKIGLDENLLKPDLSGTSGSQPADGAGGFAEVLNETMQSSAAAENTSEVKETVVGGVQTVGLSTLFPEPVQPLEDRVDQMLDALDSYRQMLGDANYTLRDMDPTVRQIAADASSLQQDMEKLPVDDELGDILNQTLIAASLEVIKFNRGDYVTA
jgi:type II secretory pathway component PulM